MDESKTFYAKLKELRESKGYSLDEISDFTKIDIRYLVSIEEGDFSCLPNVYMRLFLRSYCKYIGADSKKALDNYEFYTVGTKAALAKPFSTTGSDLKSDNSKGSSIENDLNLPQVSSAKIRSISIAVLVILIFFLIINSITTKEVDSGSAIDETTPIDTTDKVSYTPIPNERLLSNFEFQADNFLSDGSLVLPDLPPYIFTIKILEKTKVNIDSDGKVTNKIVDRGQNLRFDVKDEIRFDFWDTTHIQCHLNGTHLNDFFGTKNQSLRASFKTSNQRFYYKIYDQVSY